MLSEPLPKRVRFANLVAKQTILTGSIDLSSFIRLNAIVLEQGQEAGLRLEAKNSVTAQLEFYRGDDARSKVKGWAKWYLEVPCQRCLQAVRLELISSVMTTIVRTDEEMDGLDENEDGQVESSDYLDLVELLEDSLILELPMSPKHSSCTDNDLIPASGENTSVKHGKDDVNSSELEATEQEGNRQLDVKGDRHHPFADLKKITGLVKE